jgi:acyl-homoserine-lactone acylase
MFTMVRMRIRTMIARAMTIPAAVRVACCALPTLFFTSCAGVRPTDHSSEIPTHHGERGGHASLIRDDWGVPHIHADTESAGYHALGYAQAEDRGEVVLFLALMGMGEASALEGAAMLPSDIEARRWMHAEESQVGFSLLSPHIQENYRAYAAGFNRYYVQHPHMAPEWRFDIEPWHLVVIARGLLWGSYMAGDGLNDCRRGGVQLSRGQMESLQWGASLASNVWVLHPERTADGAIMLLSDPHGGIEEGAVFYEYRLHAGSIQSAGFSLGGMLLLPHTQFLAWGMTTGSPDVSDCYAVETDPQHPLRYRFDGEWREMKTRNVAIRAMNEEVHLQTFEYTEHNGVLSPVVARSGPTAYVVSTPYMHAAHALDEEIDRLNRARNVAEAKHAMRDLGMFGQNLMFADAEGNSWYVRAGRAPIRPDGFDWSRPVPGNGSETAWQGLHPLDDLVQIANPPEGYMQNHNLAPDRMTLAPAPVDIEDYPDYIFNDRPGRSTVRGDRTMEVLSRAQDFTVNDAIDHAMDEKWPATPVWIGALARAAATEAPRVLAWDPEYRELLQSILSFDGYARAGSARALQYFLWRQAIFSQFDDPQVQAMMRAQWTDALGSVVSPDVLLDGIPAAAALIAELFGHQAATLGDLVRIGVGDEDHPVGGMALEPWGRRLCLAEFCEATLRAFEADTRGQPIAPVRVQAGSRMLRLVVFTEPIQSFTQHNFGQSVDPSSPHFDDQARLLTSRRQVKPVYFDRNELAGRIRSEVRLRYEPSSQ